MIQRIFLAYAIGVASIPPGLCQAASQETSTMHDIPTVGFFATTFPRDSIEFGKYSEQTAVGQVIETLVSADANGELSPLLAESWSVLDGGKTIQFKIRQDVAFSNGRLLTAADAAYSISRHWHDTRSQSFGFLKDIASIVADDSHTLTIKLQRPRVAIFKVLSRDQLGVVPAGWTFDVKSSEPYIGTGPYRLVKNGADWFYLKNEHFRTPDAISVPKWRLLRGDDAESQVRSGIVPTVLTAAAERVKDLVLTTEGSAPQHTVEEQISFLQASIWWYPHGKHYKNREYQRFVMGLMRELVDLRRTKASWTKATGLVPIGVSGYLPQLTTFPPAVRPGDLSEKEPVEVKIAVYKSLRSMFFADDLYSEIERRHNVKFSISDYTENDYGKSLPARKPDIAIDGWFGGFNDPEGFLLLLPSLLSVDFDDYLADIRPIYAQAMVEQDWQKRAELFRTFNRMLVEQERLVPTWRVPTFALIDKRYRQVASIFRYTPRLTDIVRKTK